MSKIIEGIQLSEKKKKPKPTSPEKWSRAKAKARSKFDVYPSAYANAYAAKEYKKMGGGWRMGEDISEMDSQGYKGHRGDEDPGKGPEKVVKPAKTKDVAKDAEKELTKAMDKAHKKGVSEGSEGNWYVRVKGKVLKDKKFNAIPFPSQEEARSKAMELHSKKRIPLSQLKLTRSWMDAPEQGVAEGSEKNVVKSVKVGKFRHDLVDTGFGWQVRIYNGDELYDTGLSKNSEQKGLAALDDAVAYTKKQLNIKEQGVAEGAAELLKAEMPLVRHIEKELTGHGYVKGTPEYNEHFKHALAYYRKFGNVDAIKKGVAEDTTMRFAAEKLPAQNPYGGVKDRQFRGAIAETEAVNRNDGDGWRWYEPREEEQLDELKCWPGYTRVKGVPAGAVGSCKKKTKESSIMKGLQK